MFNSYALIIVGHGLNKECLISFLISSSIALGHDLTKLVDQSKGDLPSTESVFNQIVSWNINWQLQQQMEHHGKAVAEWLERRTL